MSIYTYSLLHITNQNTKNVDFSQAPRCVAGAAAQHFSAKSHCAPAAHAASTTLRETASKDTYPPTLDRTETGKTPPRPEVLHWNHHVMCAGNIAGNCFFRNHGFLRCHLLSEVKIEGFFCGIIRCEKKHIHQCQHQSINPFISSVQFGSKPHQPVSASSSRRCSKVFANESVSSVLRKLRIPEQRPTSTGMAI